MTKTYWLGFFLVSWPIVLAVATIVVSGGLIPLLILLAITAGVASIVVGINIICGGGYVF